MLKILKNWLLNSYIQLRIPGVRIGSGVALELGAYTRGDIQFGKRVRLFDHVRLAGAVKIGDYSYLNYFSIVLASHEFPVAIGKYCSISMHAVFVSSSKHHAEWLTTLPASRFLDVSSADIGAPITIGNDVWVGAGAVILPGVTIGHGAIIGAGSIVTSGTNIPLYEIWAGSPAKKIKDRFPDEIKNKLLELQWWNWNEKIKMKNKQLFTEEITNEWFKKIAV